MTGLLVKGATIFDPQFGVLERDIRVASGRILELGPRLRGESGEVVLDARGTVVMPGLINAHTHSGQALHRGSTPSLPLDVWLTRVVLADLDRDADDAYTTAAAGALEMVRTGCTAVLDHVALDFDQFDEHAEAVVSAYEDMGIRSAVAPMAADLGHVSSWPLDLVEDDFDPESEAPRYDAGELADRMIGFIERYDGRSPLTNAMLGPNAPQRCTDEYLARNASIARRYGVGIHTHLLETKTQLVASGRRFGRSVVAHLDNLGLLGARTSLAHCVWTTPEDIEIIAEREAVVVHNPVSNLRLGSGVMPMQEMLASGIGVAVGADGAASNDSQNMFEAWKLGTILHTLRGPFRSWPTPHVVWRNLLSAGSRAVGFDVGRVQTGALADLVLVRLDDYLATDPETLAAALAFAEDGRSVETVIVHGRVVWTEGGSTLVDESSIHRRARALQRRLHATAQERLADVGHLEERAGALEGAVERLSVPIQRRLGADHPSEMG